MKRALLLLMTALLVLCTACSSSHGSDPEDTGTPIYFLAPIGTAKGSDALQCSMEVLDFPENATLEEQATLITMCLLRGSSDGLLRSPFPEDTRLNSVAVQNRRVYLDFSGSFSRMDGVSLTMADYCLTLSLSAIDGIESISITVDGRSMAQQPRQVFRERDVILSTKDSVLQLVEADLYFADENGTLTAERRMLEIYEGDTQAGNLLSALMDGPASEELFPVIPADFVISSIKVEDSICRINIPSASLSALPEDEHSQWLILHSLAKSLYSLDSIREIRFSVDGIEIRKLGVISLSDIAKRPRR